jgi:hypothetical protein
MNKKLNTALFFLVATVANLLIVVALFLVVFVPFLLLVGPYLPDATKFLSLIVIFAASMFASFPIYRRLVEWFQKKVDMDKYFDPVVKLSTKKSRR